MKEYGGEENLAILNKADLPQEANIRYIQGHFKHIVKISAQNGEGCTQLDQWVREHFSVADAAESGVLTDAAQLSDLLAARASLTQAIEGLEGGFTPDLISIDITDAASALGGITGQEVADEMIDKIFSRFCVGK